MTDNNTHKQKVIKALNTMFHIWESLGEVYQSQLKAIAKGINPNVKTPYEVMITLSRKYGSACRYIEGRQSASTKRAYYSSLVVFYDKIGKTAIRDFARERAGKYTDVVREERDKNIISDQRAANFVTYEQIVERRDKLEKKMIKGDNKTILQAVALNLYSRIPPLRDVYTDMEFVTSESKMNPSKNYLLKKKNIYYVCINSDKVSSNPTHGKARYVVDSPELTAILDKSFKLFKRKYVLSNITDGNKPMSYTLFRRLMSEIWEDVNKTPCIDVFRSSYITYMYNKGMSTAEKKELARRMRHSAAEGANSYYKLLDRKQPDQIGGTKTKKKSEKKKEEDRFKPREWGIEYRKKPEVQKRMKKNRAKYYKQNGHTMLRNKILVYLNSNKAAKPQNRTIEKYKLKKNKDGVWE